MTSHYRLTGPSKRQRQQAREAWTLMGVVIGSFLAGIGLAATGEYFLAQGYTVILVTKGE